jgi:hypothetical protein
MRLLQTQILERAERLASSLIGGQTRVERNVLLAVVGDFMSDCRADPERLRKTLRLLRAGSGGHLKRGGSYGQQVAVVTAELERQLDAENLEAGDLKSLFGWTARLLLVRGTFFPAEKQAAPRRAAVPERSRRQGPAKSPPPVAFGGLNPKGLSALEKLKQQLQERDKDKKS